MRTQFARSRRTFLIQGSALAGTASLSKQAHALFESSNTSSTKVALVIGNGRYRAEALQNPPNDALAMAKTLSDLGFQCTLLLDARLAQMTDAVREFGAQLGKNKAAGLFYYAGHGAQLDWRNYLIPVDAQINRVSDMPRQALDLQELLQSLGKAQNPMNVIILDACRNNPFGNGVSLDQKGLSQFDAPPGSLLSYATAPGNTASDGEGNNGLFTENLLREMKVPNAKVEDVFKRVRLKVRLQSKGQQIPWETTSLEDDFYFNRTSAEKTEATGSDDEALWKITESSESVEAVEKYLLRFPKGRYSELAQVRLEMLLKRQGENKVQVVSSAQNPFSKGSAAGIGNYRLGDMFRFVEKDGFSGVTIGTYVDEVSAVLEKSIEFNQGQVVLDLTGNEIKSRQKRFESQAQLFPAEYVVGKKWTSSFRWLRMNGEVSPMVMNLKVTGRASFTNAAGTFNAFAVEGIGQVLDGGSWFMNYWIDPDQCPRPLRFSMRSSTGGGRRGSGKESTQVDLVEFRHKQA